MNKKYLIGLLVLIVIVAVIVVVGMNSIDSNKNVNNATNNTTNNTKTNVTVNATHIGNNTDNGESSSQSSNAGENRYREVRDPEYLGDNVIYQDTYTGKYYSQGQEMDYASLADQYNREHGVGPYS